MSWANPEPGTVFPTRQTGHDTFKPPGSYEFLASAGEFFVRVAQGDWPSDLSSPLDTSTVSGLAGTSFAWQVDFRLVVEQDNQSVVSGRITNAPTAAVISLSGSALSEGPLRQTLPPAGDFRFEQLPAGSDYVLTIEGIARLGGPFALDGTNAVTRSMALTAELAGTVDGGTAGMVVTLARVSPLGWERTTSLGSDERYTFTGLPPGRYRVSVAEQTSADIMLAEGQRTEVPPFTVTPATAARIEGRVVDTNGQVQANVDVFLSLDGEIVAQTQTGAAGEFTFGDLLAGTYSLFLPDFDVSSAVTLTAGQTQTVVLTVPGDTSQAKVLPLYLALPRVAGQDLPLQRVLLQITGDYLVTHPTAAIGFSLDEAIRAEQVILIGGEDAFSPQDQQRLEAAGCTVQRVVGDLYAIVAALGGMT